MADGLAAEHPGDIGMENDPDVYFVETAEVTTFSPPAESSGR